jgi:hypothetical protein
VSRDGGQERGGDRWVETSDEYKEGGRGRVGERVRSRRDRLGPSGSLGAEVDEERGGEVKEREWGTSAASVKNLDET